MFIFVLALTGPPPFAFFFLFFFFFILVPAQLVETWQGQLSQSWRNASKVLESLDSGKISDSLGALVYLQRKVVEDAGEGIFDDARRQCLEILSSSDDRGGSKAEEKGSRWGGWEDEETWIAMEPEAARASQVRAKATAIANSFPLKIIVVEKMPMNALCEIELVCATRKASRLLGIEYEAVDVEDVRAAVSEALRRGMEGEGESRNVSWPCGYDDGHDTSKSDARRDDFDEAQSAEEGDDEGAAEGAVVEAEIRFVSGCFAVIWCDASLPCIEKNSGSPCPKLSKVSRDVARAIAGSAAKAGLRSAHVLNVRVYHDCSGPFASGSIDAALKSSLSRLGNSTTLSVVPVQGLPKGVILRCQCIAADAPHGETEMWVKAERD